jgi:sialic acid synthase SpsE
MDIAGKPVGGSNPTYFIADVAANHDGVLERALELMTLAKEAGADAAKFQHFRADHIVSDKGFRELGGQQSHQATWSKSVYEVYRTLLCPGNGRSHSPTMRKQSVLISSRALTT